MFNNNLVCDIVVLYISTYILLHASLNHLSYLILPRYFITCVIEVNKKIKIALSLSDNNLHTKDYDVVFQIKWQNLWDRA